MIYLYSVKKMKYCNGSGIFFAMKTEYIVQTAYRLCENYI